MECDICLEKYDNSIKRPMIIIKCGHTYCAKCIDNLVKKICPSCNGNIDSIITNFAVLKTAAESEYDKLKAELEKSLKELESFEKNLAEGEKNKIKQSERVKLVKNKVENQTNVLIKLLNENKKRLFKEIEANSKESSKSLNEKLNELVVPDPKRSEIKEKLSSNKYNVDQLIEVRDDIVKQNIELYRKALKETESFDFFVNEETKIDEKFIGEIKKITILSNELEPKVLGILEGHDGLVESLALLTDGTLASGSHDKAIKIWNLETFELIKTLKGHKSYVSCLLALSDGTLASGGNDKTIRIWNIREGRAIKTLRIHNGGFNCLTLFPDGKLVSGGLDRCEKDDCNDCLKNPIQIWDIKKGKLVSMLTANTWAVFSLACLPDGSLAIGGNNGEPTIEIKNPDNDQTIRILTGHKGCISHLLIHPDGSLVSSSEQDKTIRIWDFKTGKTINSLELTCGEKTKGLSLLPNGKPVICCYFECEDDDWISESHICIWDKNANVSYFNPKGNPKRIFLDSKIKCFTILPNDLLVFGIFDGTNSIKIWKNIFLFQ